MAGSMSNFLENKVLDHTLGTTSYAMPGTVYVALFTSDPTDANTGTEVTGGAYARQSVAFSASANGATANAADINFPVATAAWGSVGFIGLFDAVTAGNLLWHDAVNTVKTISIDDQYKVAASNLTVQLD